MEKGWLQVFGLASHPFYWGSHWGYSRDTSYVPYRDVRTGFVTGKPCMNPIRYSLWAYIMENLYRPCCDVRIWVMTGTLNLFGHSVEIVYPCDYCRFFGLLLVTLVESNCGT